MLRAPPTPWVALAGSFASQPACGESGRIYVSNEVSNETGGDRAVIDAEAGRVLERISVGKRPRALKLSRDGKQLLVALSGSPIGGPGVDESKLPPADRAADVSSTLPAKLTIRSLPSTRNR